MHQTNQLVKYVHNYTNDSDLQLHSVLGKCDVLVDKLCISILHGLFNGILVALDQLNNLVDKVAMINEHSLYSVWSFTCYIYVCTSLIYFQMLIKSCEKSPT